MTSLRPGTDQTPGEKRPIDTTPKNVEGRRIVRLTSLADVDVSQDAPPSVEVVPAPRHRHRRRAAALPTSRDDWLVLAERVVGDWAATLRVALLLVLTVAAVLTVIGVVFGAGIALASALIVLIVFLAGRRRDGSARR